MCIQYVSLAHKKHRPPGSKQEVDLLGTTHLPLLLQPDVNPQGWRPVVTQRTDAAHLEASSDKDLYPAEANARADRREELRSGPRRHRGRQRESGCHERLPSSHGKRDSRDRRARLQGETALQPKGW